MYSKPFLKIYTDNGFSYNEAKSEIDFALFILFNLTPKDFLLGKTLGQNEISELNKIFLERNIKRKPLQQILGKACFYNRIFIVDENTLIPRPETELLVNEVLKLSEEIKSPKILDIGTGTGCIPITLVLENSSINAHSVDISPKALEIAEKNSNYHNTTGKVKFIQSDLFQNITEKYDIIVSNPPYIPIKYINTLEDEVKNYDPKLALFAYDENGIEFYEKIITSCQNYLKDNGYLCFELGINQSNLVKNILEKQNFKNIKIIKDFNSIDRIIIGQK